MTKALCEKVASITDFKKDPEGVVAIANGEPVAILNKSTPIFYCVPPDLFDRLEDFELLEIARSRADEKRIKVDINDL